VVKSGSRSVSVTIVEPIKVAVLGFWHVHARDYARRAVDHPRTELVVVWDDDEERGRAGADEFGVPYTADFDALLASDIDAVIVTTATSAHEQVMVAAAEAGKHIFTEKVLAPTVGAATALIAAADASEVKLTVSLPRLYHGYTQTIRELLRADTLGEVNYGRVRLSHDGAVSRPRTAAWLPERFFEPDEAIGGAFTDLGCHPAYLIQLFLGMTPETVSATYRAFTHRRLEDHAVVTLGYGDQRIGVAEAGFVSRGPFAVDLMGTEGWLSYRAPDDVVRIGGAGSADPVRTVTVAPDEPDAFSQWVKHIDDDTRADDNLARAVELTRLVVAANSAAATGATVSYAA
jgi:1,5-anhydro-D-fructose reductase (1,5-anhydro-D-mannitol-forming)